LEALVDVQSRTLLGVSVLWLSLVPAFATAQGDALELQQRAIQRIDAIVDHFRKTGEYQSRLPELAQVELELGVSNRMLAGRGDWSALALGLIKQGHCYRMQGQWDRAIPFYQQAEQAAARGQNAGRQSEALTWKAAAESSRRNLGQAAADARQAVQLAEGAADNDALAHALEVLGTVQVYQLDLAGAGDTFNRDVSVAKQARDSMALYYAYLGRADVFQKSAERCDFQRAFEPCRQALERARADYDQAVAIARQRGFSGLAGHAEKLLKNLELRQGLNQLQEKSYGSDALRSIFHPKTPKDVLVTDRFIAEPGGIPPQLLALYNETKLGAKGSGALANVVNEPRDYFLEGRMHEVRGNNDAALDFYLKAVNTLEGDRRALRDERSRGTFLEDRIVFYYAAVLQLLAHKRYADAFDVLERSRSRALADLLASRKPGLGRPGEQKLYAESAVLRTQIADAQSRLFELASQADGSKESPAIAGLRTQIRTLESQYAQVTARMAAEAPRLQNLLTSAPASLSALQQTMRDERFEMLQYLVIDEAVIVWHISPASVTVRNVFLPRNQVIDKVSALQKSLADRNTPFDETTAQELFLYLIAPVLPLVRSERLVIVPHQDLHYVPFQVFRDPGDGRYLGERFQITYAPSATVLLGLARPAGLSGGRLLAIADPTITAAGPEVKGIAKLFPQQAKVVTDDLAREDEVKAWIRDFDVIHLSVHGKFDAAEPMLSYLSFARGSNDDGRLTAAEMFGLPLDRNRLIVLSACETGRAEATHANEILGMVRALIYAGAGTLVLSYWEVDSAATALWMQAFYEAALTQPLPAAARTALLKVKNTPNYRHPYYWAAFGVTGR
jgi:CHAT domain-containing protein